jgi:hypothetical protein
MPSELRSLRPRRRQRFPRGGTHGLKGGGLGLENDRSARDTGATPSDRKEPTTINVCRSTRRALLCLLLSAACLGLVTTSAAAEPAPFSIGPGLTATLGTDALGLSAEYSIVGQTITAGGLLQGFTFWFAPGLGSVTMRPELRNPEGSKILWQGAEVTIDPAPCGSPGPPPECFQPVFFGVPSIALDGKSQYLIDVRDVADEVAGGGVLAAWNVGDTYAGGYERDYLNASGGNPAQWISYNFGGVTTNTDLAFVAQLVPEPNIVHIGYCAVAGNYNPMSGVPIPAGTFLNLVADQPKTDPAYAGATTAIFVQDRGITCDAPPPGYVEQGFAPESLHVPGNVYRYWVAGP